MTPREALRNAVTGAIERGEGEAIEHCGLVISICPNEPRATVEVATPAAMLDLANCIVPGDAGPALRHVLAEHNPRFTITARRDAGSANPGYETRTATPAEMQAACEAIYFESESDFTDSETAALHLLWQAADTEESM